MYVAVAAQVISPQAPIRTEVCKGGAPTTGGVELVLVVVEPLRKDAGAAILPLHADVDRGASHAALQGHPILIRSLASAPVTAGLDMSKECAQLVQLLLGA